MRPATDYAAFRRRLSRRQFWGTVIRTIGYIATALICSTFIHHVEPTWLFAIGVGLVTGIAVGATVNPTSSITRITFPNVGSGFSASGSFFAASLCNPCSIGSRYSMCR